MTVTRRRFIQTSAVGAALAGITSFYGPWKHNRAYAQTKPIKLGLTNDASGQFGNSGRDDHRAIRMAIDEQNAKGGMLGRKIEWITADTESNPAVATRVAERFIRSEEHTSELQSLRHLVCRLLLEKKKQKNNKDNT